jgi:TolB-like protein
MKKVFVVLALCLAGSVVFAQNVTLDAAIQSVALEMGQILPQGSKVAVVNFISPSEALSRYVIDGLNDAITNGRQITVVDRQRLDLILGELRLQDESTGLVSEETAQEIGRFTGAQYIVTGSMELAGLSYRFRTQAITVEGAVISYSGSRNVPPNDVTVESLARGGIRDFTPAEISRTRALNFLWGAGSFSIQKDIFGGAVVAALDTAGLAGIITGLMIISDPDSFADNRTDGGYDSSGTIMTGSFIMTGGVALYVAGCIFGYIRPASYHRPGSMVAKGFMDPTAWNISLVSDSRGDPGLRVNYKINF